MYPISPTRMPRATFSEKTTDAICSVTGAVGRLEKVRFLSHPRAQKLRQPHSQRIVHLYVWLPTCLPVRLPACLSACLPACLSVSLAARCPAAVAAGPPSPPARPPSGPHTHGTPDPGGQPWRPGWQCGSQGICGWGNRQTVSDAHIIKNHCIRSARPKNTFSTLVQALFELDVGTLLPKAIKRCPCLVAYIQWQPLLKRGSMCSCQIGPKYPIFHFK
jgi:hypothetical protein